MESNKRAGINVGLSMQIDELLHSNSPDYSKLAKLTKFIDSVTSAIKQMPEKVLSDDYKAEYPHISFKQLSKYPLTVSAPTCTALTGSYPNRRVVKPACEVDVIVTLPSSMFQTKDYNNYRYLDKRNAILGRMHEHLSSLGQWEVDLVPFQGNSDKPVVTVKVAGSAWLVQLIPAITPDTFDSSKLVRETPFHDQAVLEDMYLSSSAAVVEAILDIYPSGKSACMLLRLWLNQRGLLKQAGLGGFAASVLIAHACSAGSVPRDATPVQLLKAVLTFIGRVDWTSKVHELGKVGLNDKAATSAPTILLPGTPYNLFWRIPTLTLVEISKVASAQQSMQQADGQFAALFDKKPDWRDISITLTAPWGALASGVGNAVQVLRQALGKRLKPDSVAIRLHGTSCTILASLDPIFSSSSLDKGPAADSKEASDFRSFWGPKAEVRRFKDGSILECVAWQETDGVSISEQIIKFAFNRHLSGTPVTGMHVAPLGTVSSGDRWIWTAFEELKSVVSDKLQSSAVLPVGEAFSYTSLVDTVESSVRRGISRLHACAAAEVVVEIEGFEEGPEWPSESAEAQWCIRVASLLRILRGFRGAGNSNCEIFAQREKEPFLDVRVAAGEHGDRGFRIYVYHKSEFRDGVSRKFLYAPKLRQQLHALALREPAYPAAVLAAKGWADNRLCLDSQISEFIELSVAKLFVSTDPPTSAHSGFLRWLDFMAQSDFQVSPITVAFEGSEEPLIAAFSACPMKQRPAVWMGSSVDPQGTHAPSLGSALLDRIQGQARATINLAKAGNWQAVKFGTDNDEFWDVTYTLSDPAVNSCTACKGKSCVHFCSPAQVFIENVNRDLVEAVGISRSHNLLGLRFKKTALLPQPMKALVEGNDSWTIIEADKKFASTRGDKLPDLIAVGNIFSVFGDVSAAIGVDQIKKVEIGGRLRVLGDGRACRL